MQDGPRQALSRVKELFGLNTDEVAGLFGVSPQTVDEWDETGDFPPESRRKLTNLLSVGQLLERKLSPDRLPRVTRRQAAAYGGLTMLDMVAAGRDAELRELTERAFDWSGGLPDGDLHDMPSFRPAQERLGELVEEMEREAGPASSEAYERVLAQWFGAPSIDPTLRKGRRHNTVPDPTDTDETPSSPAREPGTEGVR